MKSHFMTEGPIAHSLFRLARKSRNPFSRKFAMMSFLMLGTLALPQKGRAQQEFSPFSLPALSSLSSSTTNASSIQEFNDPTLVRRTETPYGFRISEYVLPNGLHVVLSPQKFKTGVMSLQTWFRVGSIHEKADPVLKKTGFAHLFEHMMFKGTEKNPNGVLEKMLTALGVSKLNATTSYDRTNYIALFPTQNLKTSLPKILDLDLDRFAKLKVHEDSLGREKNVVISEIEKRSENAMGFAYEYLYSLVFKGSQYEYSIAGTPAEVSSTTVEECEYFLKNYYSPNNMSLLISGDIDEAEVLPIVKSVYGGWAATKTPELKLLAPPKITEKRLEVIEHSFVGPNPQLLIGFQAPPASRAEATSLISFALDYLTDGPSSPLHKALVETKMALGIGSDINLNLKGGMAVIHVTIPEGGDPQAVFDKIAEVLKSSVVGTIDPRRIKSIVAQKRLGSAYNFEKAEVINSAIGDSIVSGGDSLNFLKGMNASKVASPDVLRKIIGLHLDPDKMTGVLAVQKTAPAPKSAEKAVNKVTLSELTNESSIFSQSSLRWNPNANAEEALQAARFQPAKSYLNTRYTPVLPNRQTRSK